MQKRKPPDKWKPHYNLKELKRLAQDVQTISITRKSRINYQSLGFSLEEVIEVILSLDSSNFYKSMTYDNDNKVWQDVYKTFKKNTKLYIKLLLSTVDGKVIITSFKRDEEGGL